MLNLQKVDEDGFRVLEVEEHVSVCGAELPEPFERIHATSQYVQLEILNLGHTNKKVFLHTFLISLIVLAPHKGAIISVCTIRETTNLIMEVYIHLPID